MSVKLFVILVFAFELGTVCPSDVLIKLKANTQGVLDNFSRREFLTRGDRITTLKHELQSHAAVTQKSVIEILKTKSEISFKSFWISNKILVQNADSKLIAELESHPDVEAVNENRKIELDRPLNKKRVKHFNNEVQYGIKMIGADKVWAAGINGTGIRIGAMDSGVRYTHESIRDNFLGKYGWFDAVNGENTPVDLIGHGTHVTATIAGSKGIGVAPGAKWMHCRAVDYGSSEDRYLACAEYFLCPTLPDGSEPNCSMAPVVVSNSWGRRGDGLDFLDDSLKAWYAAGIIPVFSNGNYGPSCSSLLYPPYSNTPIITVGAIDIEENVPDFSSLGPTPDGRIRPNIAAPGVDVLSAGNYNDYDYTTMSGTSMAAPHVAGVIALIHSANPTLSTEQIVARLYASAEHTVKSTGKNCGGIPETTYPNNAVGHGRISAVNSILNTESNF